MIILDSLMLSGLRWVLETIATAADTELNDDRVLRERLLEAEMRREAGEVTEDEFADIERDLLARIREMKERREGGLGPVSFGRRTERSSERIEVEAAIEGEFHETWQTRGSGVGARDAGHGTRRSSRGTQASRPGTRRSGPVDRTRSNPGPRQQPGTLESRGRNPESRVRKAP
jgi:Gas vesicle protein G